MVGKALFKNPVLIIGILFMLIFIADYRKRKGLLYREELQANSCTAALVMLKKRIPENWETHCRGNNMSVKIELEKGPGDIALKQLKPDKLRQLLYREMANQMIFIARNSSLDSLREVEIITMRLNTPKLQINALTEGRHLFQLANMQNPEFLAKHLEATVRVQEVNP